MKRSYRPVTLGVLVGLSVLVLAQAPAQAQYGRPVFPRQAYSNAFMYSPYGWNAYQTAAYNAYLRNQTLAYNLYLRNQTLAYNAYLRYQTLLYNQGLNAPRPACVSGACCNNNYNSADDTQASCNNNDGNNNNNNTP